MPIGFLVPAFLAGLAALLVPLLLHLRRRDRRKPRPFPSLMFLARMPVQTDSKRRITDWPLLILRGLLLALLVAAFARPFIRGGEFSAQDSVGLTVLLLDRSASMSAAGVDDQWADSARAVIDDLTDGRRIAVVAFDVSAQILQSPTTDHTAARTAISQVPDAAGATRFGAGLRAASQLLAHEPVPGEIVVVSDMQRSGLAATTAPALPAGTTLRVVIVSPSTLDNSAVLAIDVEPVEASSGRRAVVAARIDRLGGDVPRETEVSLEVDGRQMQSQSVVLPGDGSRRVTFDTVEMSRAESRVSVRLEPDGFVADDSRQVVVPADAATRITLVVPRDVRDDEVRYVEQALIIGRDPGYQVDRVTRLDRATIEGSAAVVLLDVPPPEDAVAGILAEWLSGGGGLIVAAGERLGSRRVSSELFAASLVGMAERSSGAVLGGAAVSHPALAMFRDTELDAFASVRIRRHAVAEPDDAATVLLRYDDGQPAAIASAYGQGRVILLAIPLNVRRGDFPLQPSFLPFVRGVAGWASGQSDQSVAEVGGLPWMAPASIANPVVRSPTGEILRPATGARFVVLREAGFHEVFEGRTGGVPTSLVAVNSPTAESDLTPALGDDLLIGIAEAPPITTLLQSEVAAAQEARQRGWRWVLLILLLILGVEVVVASRGWRGVAAHAPVVSGSEGSSP